MSFFSRLAKWGAVRPGARNVTAKTSSDGGLANIVGKSNSALIAGMVGRVPLKVSGYGNSIIAASTFYDSALTALSGGRLKYTGTNGGITGNTAAQMAARLGTDIPNAPVVFVQEGTNSAAAGISVSQDVANMKTVLQAHLNAGILPIMCVPPPRNDAYNSAVYRLGIGHYELARSMGLMVVRPWEDYVDPTTGQWVAGAPNGDGIHPNVFTHFGASAAIWQQLSGVRPVAYLPVTNNPSYGLNNNCLFLSNDGTVPNGGQWMGVAAGVTFSLSSATAPDKGKWARVTGAGASAGYGYLMGYWSTGFSAGDTLRVTFRLRAANFIENSVRIFVRTLPSYVICKTIFYDTKLAMDGTVEAEFVVPAGATRVDLLVGLNNGGTETGYLEIAQCQLVNVTTALG